MRQQFIKEETTEAAVYSRRRNAVECKSGTCNSSTAALCCAALRSVIQQQSIKMINIISQLQSDAVSLLIIHLQPFEGGGGGDSWDGWIGVGISRGGSTVVAHCSIQLLLFFLSTDFIQHKNIG